MDIVWKKIQIDIGIKKTFSCICLKNRYYVNLKKYSTDCASFRKTKNNNNIHADKNI